MSSKLQRYSVVDVIEPFKPVLVPDDRGRWVEATDVRDLCDEADRTKEALLAAVALVTEMWSQAECWAGERASSHYRSAIMARMAAVAKSADGKGGAT